MNTEFKIQQGQDRQRRLELDLSVVEVNCSLKATFQLTNDADFEMATMEGTKNRLLAVQKKNHRKDLGNFKNLH